MIKLGFSLLLTIWLASPGFANDNKSSQRLSQLRQEIALLEKSLKKTSQDKTNSLQQLKFADKHIGKLNLLVQHVDQDINRQKRQIKKLQQQIHKQQQQVKQHQQQLVQQIRSAHTLGHEEYLKVLLTTPDPGSVSRMLKYYDYFNAQRITAIKRNTTTIKRLSDLTTALHQQTQTLSDTRQQHHKDLAIIASSRQKRQQLIASLNRKIVGKQQKLRQLRSNEKHLRRLLGQLVTENIEDITQIRPQTPFRQLKGKLSWPTQGNILQRFGQRQLGDLRTKGMLFATQEGQLVRAVAAGKVIYADWIRGFGMMIIIYHDRQYMSLYGHNTSLLKEKGDWVDNNDIIANAGASGGASQNGLYFELRHKGKPINPIRWLKKLKK